MTDQELEQSVINQFAKLPIDDKKRIHELINNPKALAGLKKHWFTLKLMFK